MQEVRVCGVRVSPCLTKLSEDCVDNFPNNDCGVLFGAVGCFPMLRSWRDSSGAAKEHVRTPSQKPEQGSFFRATAPASMDPVQSLPECNIITRVLGALLLWQPILFTGYPEASHCHALFCYSSFLNWTISSTYTGPCTCACPWLVLAGSFHCHHLLCAAFAVPHSDHIQVHHCHLNTLLCLLPRLITSRSITATSTHCSACFLF